MKEENPVFRSLELIESQISEKLTVGNIAGGVYFSKNHYQRLFRETVGNSVMEYVTKRKLTLAGRALLETDAAILDIALDYGYDSRDGFTRSFKGYMGVTPTEYRKYGLAAISQKTMKERPIMKYSKATDEILRELNEFIAKAKETAEAARKCTLPWYKEFWENIAAQTDTYSGKLEAVLERIGGIAERPDEITNRFSILKVIDDTAFALNALVFSAELTAARAKPEDYQAMRPLYERYRELMQMISQKISAITQFFNELSALIFEDMRKTFAGKMEEVVRKARAAADGICGYAYIKSEFMNIADALVAIPIEDITAHRLDDELFKLPILRFAIDADVLRSGGRDKAMFDGVEPFKQSLEDAVGFIQTLPAPEAEEPMVVRVAKVISDIGYQGNILLFFTRGEAEKLGDLLNDEQKAAVDTICHQINHYIHFTQSSADASAFQPIADRICAIKDDMAALADQLGEYGGALKFISLTFGQLHVKVTECIQAFETD